MSVAGHLRISPPEYDVKIRALIPLYDELIHEASRALDLSCRPIRTIVDLGIGTGALARACLGVAPRARIWGIDADDTMMTIARRRLGPRAQRVRFVHGSFLTEVLPRCDAIVASYALHHIRTRRAKIAFYRRCFAALRPGGLLVSGDCMPASTPSGFARDLEMWISHLGRSFGGRGGGRRVYESWADEDTYVPLSDEMSLLARAGFDVDVTWRKGPFAVVAAIRPAAASRRR